MLNGEVVLIMGGTSGTGRAAATALAAMGAEVVVAGRDMERGDAAVEEIRETSGTRLPYSSRTASVGDPRGSGGALDGHPP